MLLHTPFVYFASDLLMNSFGGPFKYHPRIVVVIVIVFVASTMVCLTFSGSQQGMQGWQRTWKLLLEARGKISWTT